MRSRIARGFFLIALAGCAGALRGAARAQSSVGAGPGAAAQPGSAQAAASLQMTAEELRHATPEWQTIASHLPDPATATPQRMELVADVLRARKFPDEALGYYRHALDRGGPQVDLLNKIGVTEMELQMDALAMQDFKRATKLDKKNADAWNNLASAEYLRRNFGSAAGDFRKAVKLNRKSATFHANLANAYFQEKNFIRARKEFETAARLDPHIFEYHGSGGARTQLQSPEDRGRFCYELARLYASEGNADLMLHWLAASAESGFDVIGEMRNDATMSKYRKDPRVTLLVKNGRSLQDENALDRSGDRPPPLSVNQPMQ